MTRDELVRSLRRHKLRPGALLNLAGWMRGKVPEEYQPMVQWIGEEGFRADIHRLKADFSSLTNVDRWARHAQS